MTDDERKARKRESALKYYHKNKDKINEKARNNQKLKVKLKKNYENLTEAEKLTRKKYNKEYREKNKSKIKEQRKEYRRKNKELIRERKRVYSAEKRKSDPMFKLKENTRTLIKNSFFYKNHKKNTKTCIILGCSFDEFKLHLESQFESWMNWDNYGLYNGELSYGWDIDHIIPLSTAKTKDDIIKLNHYTNLQPLCSYINRNIKRFN